MSELRAALHIRMVCTLFDPRRQVHQDKLPQNLPQGCNINAGQSLKIAQNPVPKPHGSQWGRIYHDNLNFLQVIKHNDQSEQNIWGFLKTLNASTRSRLANTSIQFEWRLLEDFTFNLVCLWHQKPDSPQQFHCTVHISQCEKLFPFRGVSYPILYHVWLFSAKNYKACCFTYSTGPLYVCRALKT